MPGFLLHMGATVLCAHAGQAQPTVTNPRVTVSGQPIVTQSAPYTVAGCTLPPPPTASICPLGEKATERTRNPVEKVPIN